MVIRYQKDMKKNYMVIEAMDASQEEYCLRMIQRNKISGVLPVEERRIDQSVFYYYDISGKQSIDILWSKMKLDYKTIYGVISDITRILFCCYDYLLDGDSFIITPNLIFYDLTRQEYSLTYVIHHKKDIKEQFCELIEYFMNVIDYEDKEAVYFIYQIHGIAKREEFTLQDLEIPLAKRQSDSTDGSKNIESMNQKYTETKHKAKEPYEVKQEVSDVVHEEREVTCYPIKTYLFTGLIGVVAIVLIVFVLRSGILLNEMRTGMDTGKLAGFFLILVCFVAYVMGRVWDKAQRITRYETEPSKLVDLEPIKINHTPEKREIGNQVNSDNKEAMETDYNNLLYIEEYEEESEEECEETISNPTVLLSEKHHETRPKLVPLVSLQEPMILSYFPFVVGKHNKHVDYLLNYEVISRYHAKITREGERYYLSDLNSTNGTYKNDIALPIYEPQEIYHGDIVSFADIKYQFYI